MKNLTPLFLTTLLTLVLSCFVRSSGYGKEAQVSKNEPLKPVAIAYSKLPQGSFALVLKNGSNGTLNDDQINIQVLSLPSKAVSYISVLNSKVTGASQGEGSLGKVNSAQPGEILPSFTLADLQNHTLYLPGDGKYYGTRIYVSIKKPLTMVVNATGDGYSQPDLQNPADPNYPIPYDWFEMTYDPTPQPNDPTLDTVAFGGNMTQVDEFSIPMAFTILGVNGTTQTRGITLGEQSSSGVTTRDQLINKYLSASDVAAPFKELQQVVAGKVVRLMAPYHSTIFQPGGTDAGYFDDYLNTLWNYYTSHQLDYYDQPGKTGNHYVGSVINDLLTFSCNGTGSFTLVKPTTLDVFTNAGSFLPGPIPSNALGAQLAAAINRHVATDTSSWLVPGNYYQAEPSNDWAKFWHEVSIDHLAYGFGFDDVAGQSSVAILPATENLFSLTITIGW